MNLRWLLVPPAFVAGIILVPILVNIAWELGFLVLPHHNWLTEVIEAIKSLVGGLAGVAVAQIAAPSHTRYVGVTCAALTVGISIAFVPAVGAYLIFHLALTCIGAIASVWFWWNSEATLKEEPST